MSDFILKGRVIRLWRQPVNKKQSETYSIELILLDTQGSKIQVTVLNNYVSKFKRYLQERLCLQISNAKLGSNKGNQKFCDNPHKISLFEDTKVTICEDFGGSIHGFKLVSFEDIKHYKLPTDLSLDIIAYVSTCSEIMELKLKNGKDSKHCVATVNDMKGNNLQFTLWDEYYAVQLTTYKRKNPTVEPVVVILQFAKYKACDAGPSVSNMYFGSKLYINTKLPEIEAFKNKLLFSEVAALIVGDIGDCLEKRDIIVNTQEGLLKRISELHPSYLPLQYPLFFPYDDDGYRVDIYSPDDVLNV